MFDEGSDLAARTCRGSSAPSAGSRGTSRSVKFAPRNPVLEMLICTVCPPGQVTVPAARSIVELAACRRRSVLDLALRDRGEHIDVTLGELGADRPVAIGGIAQDPVGPSLWRLAVDQVLGLRAVGLRRPGRRAPPMISGSLLFVAAAESL